MRKKSRNSQGWDQAHRDFRNGNSYTIKQLSIFRNIYAIHENCDRELETIGNYIKDF